MKINIPKLPDLRQLRQIQMYKPSDEVMAHIPTLMMGILVLFILVKKDFRFSLSLKSKHIENAHVENPEIVQIQNAPKAAPVSLNNGVEHMGIVSDYKKVFGGWISEKTVQEEIDNEANKFNNIGFIMNPTYAKRNNIDPKIVARKKKICKDYVEQFAPVAISEMNKYDIPASITLAQALLESDAGGSRLARKNQNHFGIKCFSKTCKRGHCSNFSDDTHKDFFRKYESTWESYRAHSEFLQNKRYKKLFKYEIDDYKSWANGLRSCGYATDKRYAKKLITIIENMKLYEYDK